MTLKKVENGRYRSTDGLYEVVEVDGDFVVNQRQGYKWVTVGTEKTKTKAESAVSKLQGKEESDVDTSSNPAGGQSDSN